MVVTDEVQPSVGQKTARKWVKSAPDIPTSLVAFTAKAEINGGLKSSAKEGEVIWMMVGSVWLAIDKKIA